MERFLSHLSKRLASMSSGNPLPSDQRFYRGSSWNTFVHSCITALTNKKKIATKVMVGTSANYCYVFDLHASL
jgi:hypothetical protein